MINTITNKITDNINFNNSTQTVSYLNIYNYMVLRKSPELIKFINYFTLDGIMLVVFVRIFKGIKVQRKSPDFSSYFLDLFAFLNNKKKKLFFIGGTFEEIKNFANEIKINYPNINIVGYHDGFNINEDELINEVIYKETEIVIVGMGTPKQEFFMSRIKKLGYNGACFACGAFFSQTAIKGKNYYPTLINHFHLRWLYRIYREPKLFKRYFFYYPIGLIYLIKDSYSIKSTQS